MTQIRQDVTNGEIRYISSNIYTFMLLNATDDEVTKTSINKRKFRHFKAVTSYTLSDKGDVQHGVAFDHVTMINCEKLCLDKTQVVGIAMKTTATYKS